MYLLVARFRVLSNFVNIQSRKQNLADIPHHFTDISRTFAEFKRLCHFEKGDVEITIFKQFSPFFSSSLTYPRARVLPKGIQKSKITPTLCPPKPNEHQQWGHDLPGTSDHPYQPPQKSVGRLTSTTDHYRSVYLLDVWLCVSIFWTSDYPKHHHRSAFLSDSHSGLTSLAHVWKGPKRKKISESRGGFRLSPPTELF